MVISFKMFSEDDESQEEKYVNYKQKYRELKKHLRALIYENECFQDELRKAQRNFVSISRDKSFLLDRLLKYEKNMGQSSDSDLTESSEDDDDSKVAAAYAPASLFGSRKKITKRKRSEAELNGNLNQSSDHQPSSKVAKMVSKPTAAKLQSAAAKKAKKPPAARKPSTKKEKAMSQNMNVQQILKAYNMDDVHLSSEERSHTGASLSEDYTDGSHRYEFTSEGQMTREDIERHLEARRFSPEMEMNTTATVPAELFSQEESEGSEVCEFLNLEEDAASADMILE